MLKNHFKSAFRSLAKNRATTIINILGLSVGMSAAVFVMLWVSNENNFDDYKDKGSIYRLTTRIPSQGWVWETTPLLLANAIRNDVPEIENASRLQPYNAPVFRLRGNLVYEKECAYVDESWFKIFKTAFIDGNASSFNSDPYSIILTSSEAKKYFPAGTAMGKTIHIDSAEFQVKAIIADPANNSSFQYKAYLPLSARLQDKAIRENDEQWGNANYITFIKVRAGSDINKVAQKINDVLKARSKDADAPLITLTSLKDMHFETDTQFSGFARGSRNTIYIFSLIGFGLLLIACINYVNLTTAKAALRAREVSVRKVVGASRLNLFAQFVMESVVISALALAVTIILIKLFLPSFNSITGGQFSISLISVELWEILGFTLLISFLLNSIYPAILLSSFNPLKVLKGITILKTNNGLFRKGLVVIQFGFSVILIAGTIIIYRQMQFIQDSNPGYNMDQVLYFVLPPGMNHEERASKLAVIKSDIERLKGVEAVSSANQPIVDMGSYCTGCADWSGHDTAYNPKIAQLSADADFPAVMKIKMKEGRWFNKSGVVDAHGFILNETAVKDFKIIKPVIGETFIFKGDTGSIIGIVRDFKYRSMHEKLGPLVVFDQPEWRSLCMVRIAAGHMSEVTAGLRQVWNRHLAGFPFEYKFLDETFNNLYKDDQRSSLLLFVFAAIAIGTSALGLFSLSTFEASVRSKEIGIRKVLGCTVTGIVSLLSKDFLKLVVLAILISTPVTWWAMNKWLANFAYRVDLSWLVFASAGIIAIAIAFFTVSFQAVKAAIASPVHSLKAE